MIEIDLSHKNLKRIVHDNYPGLFIGLGLGYLIAMNVQHIPRLASAAEPVNKVFTWMGPSWASPEVMMTLFVTVGAIIGAYVQYKLRGKK